uniref:UspA domain-containing protein n=1 Tax=Arcella intermedia TaxID=1963864 RepID=A0A6B2LNV1_9EUKA
MVPVDIDAPSHEAFRFAVKITKPSDELYLMHIERKIPSIAPVPPFVEEGTTMVPPELALKLKEEILRECQSAHRHCKWVQRKSINGDIAHELCKFAEHEKVDQVIMGGRGLGSFGGIILGSVSQAVLKECRCPVTVVKKSTPESHHF